jgi:hypothetical protein
MTPEQNWKNVFTNWPTGIPRAGILTNTLNEPNSFKSFFIKDDVLLLERTNPDALGARFILMGFDTIHSVKFTDPLKEAVITGAGFVGKLAKH